MAVICAQETSKQPLMAKPQMLMTELPNDWMSNTVFLITLPLVTAVTMRVRDSVCKRQQSLRTKYAVDLSYLLVTNLVSFSSLIIWCFALDQPLTYVVAVDLLFCIWVERWLYKVIASYDSTSYHPGATIGKFMIRQRMQLFCVLAGILRGYCAALTEAFESHFAEKSNGSYETTVLLIPCMYAFVRTVALDVEAKQTPLFAPEDSTEASTFTITDEEEAYETGSDHGDVENVVGESDTSSTTNVIETSM